MGLQAGGLLGQSMRRQLGRDRDQSVSRWIEGSVERSAGRKGAHLVG